MNLINSVYLIAGLLLLWASWGFFWRRYQLDRFRDELFLVRHELFMVALKEKMALDGPAYQMLRTLLNGMIENAERFSLVFLLLSLGVERPKSFADPAAEWSAHVERLPGEVQERLRALNTRAFLALTEYVAYRSIAMLCLLFVFRITTALKRTGVSVGEQFGRKVGLARVQEEAYFSQQNEMLYSG